MNAYIFAGANASGKSTLIAFLLSRGLIKGTYVNPDLILKEELELAESLENYLQAFEIAKERRESLMAAGADIILETVFSTEDKMDFIRQLKARGYHVTLFFVGTQTPSINAAYLTERVLQGGHDVPIRKLIDRRTRGFELVRKIRDQVDHLIVVDNSLIDAPPEILFSFLEGKPCHWGKSRAVDWYRLIGIEDFNTGACVDTLCAEISAALSDYQAILRKTYHEKNRILQAHASMSQCVHQSNKP